MRCVDAQAKFVTIEKSRQQSITMRRLMRITLMRTFVVVCVFRERAFVENSNLSWRGAGDHRPLIVRAVMKTCWNPLLSFASSTSALLSSCACINPFQFPSFISHAFRKILHSHRNANTICTDLVIWLTNAEWAALRHRRWVSTPFTKIIFLFITRTFFSFIFSASKLNP